MVAIFAEVSEGLSSTRSPTQPQDSEVKGLMSALSKINFIKINFI